MYGNKRSALAMETKHALGGGNGDGGDDEVGEVKGLLDAFQSTVLGRIEAIEGKFDVVEKHVLKSQRPNMAGGPADDASSPERRKSLEAGIRELIRGNQGKADAHFATAMQQKGMTAGSDPDGGYMLAPEFGAMQTIPAEISPLSAMAREIQLVAGTSYEEPIDRDRAAAAWVGENEARPDTATPKLGMFRVECGELYAMPKASQTLVDSTRIDVISWLSGKIAEAFGIAEDVAFHTGNGVAKPRGILTYPVAAQGDAVRPWGTIEFVATGASGAFPTPTTSVGAGDPLVDLVAALKPMYRPNASWLLNRATAAIVRKLKDADGRWIWSDSLAAGTPDRLLGYPVAYSESMPTVAPASLSIAFGDLRRSYTVVRRLGVKLLSDPFTDKPNIRLYGYQRVGGGISNFESLKFLKFS